MSAVQRRPETYSDTSGCLCAFCRTSGPTHKASYETYLRRSEIDIAMPTIHVKFRCLEVTRRYTHTDVEQVDHFQYRVKLAPVMAKSKTGGYDQDHENKAFYDATPGGEIELTGLRESAASAFTPGQAYLIEFTPADG